MGIFDFAKKKDTPPPFPDEDINPTMAPPPNPDQGAPPLGMPPPSQMMPPQPPAQAPPNDPFFSPAGEEVPPPPGFSAPQNDIFLSQPGGGSPPPPPGAPRIQGTDDQFTPADPFTTPEAFGSQAVDLSEGLQLDQSLQNPPRPQQEEFPPMPSFNPIPAPQEPSPSIPPLAMNDPVVVKDVSDIKAAVSQPAKEGFGSSQQSLSSSLQKESMPFLNEGGQEDALFPPSTPPASVGVDSSEPPSFFDASQENDPLKNEWGTDEASSFFSEKPQDTVGREPQTVGQDPILGGPTTALDSDDDGMPSLGLIPPGDPEDPLLEVAEEVPDVPATPGMEEDIFAPIPEGESNLPADLLEGPTREVGDGPLFVNVEDYVTLLDTFKDLHGVIKRVDENTATMSKLRTQINAAEKIWHSNLDEVHRKLMYIDKVLFEE